MTGTFLAKARTFIQVPPSFVWEALTNPTLVKQYLFGTEVTSDWKVGSSITYRGEWEGKPYEDKGTILQSEPGKKLVSTYWSSMSGTTDIPENYNTVSYELFPEDGGTQITVTQSNNASQEAASHSEQNWKLVLAGMKKLLEESNQLQDI